MCFAYVKSVFKIRSSETINILTCIHISKHTDWQIKDGPSHDRGITTIIMFMPCIKV